MEHASGRRGSRPLPRVAFSSYFRCGKAMKSLINTFAALSAPEGRARHSETVSKPGVRRDELHESLIFSAILARLGTRVTRPSGVLRQSHSVRAGARTRESGAQIFGRQRSAAAASPRCAVSPISNRPGVAKSYEARRCSSPCRLEALKYSRLGRLRYFCFRQCRPERDAPGQIKIKSINPNQIRKETT